MKVALYARVSSEKQDVDLSVASQFKALREYAAKNQHQIIREFVDEAESARTADRPSFQRMIGIAKDEGLDKVNSVMLGENREMRSLVVKQGFKLKVDLMDDLVEAELIL